MKNCLPSRKACEKTAFFCDFGTKKGKAKRHGICVPPCRLLCVCLEKENSCSSARGENHHRLCRNPCHPCTEGPVPYRTHAYYSKDFGERVLAGRNIFANEKGAGQNNLRLFRCMEENAFPFRKPLAGQSRFPSGISLVGAPARGRMAYSSPLCPAQREPMNIL